MKKIIYGLAALALVVLSCNDEDYNSAFREYAGIRTTGLPTIVDEDSDASVEIPVYYGGTFSNQTPFTVSYTVSGGAYGVNYTIEGGTSASGQVTIAPGETGKEAFGTIRIKTVPNDDPNTGNVVLTITLSGTSNGINVGYPYKQSYVLTIREDDCAYDASAWAGDFSALEDYGDGNPYGPYDVTFVQDETDPNKFTFSDFWDSGITAYVIFDPNSKKITFPDQDDGDGEAITGEGTYSQCSKSFTITTHYAGYTWNYVFEKYEEE